MKKEMFALSVVSLLILIILINFASADNSFFPVKENGNFLNGLTNVFSFKFFETGSLETSEDTFETPENFGPPEIPDSGDEDNEDGDEGSDEGSENPVIERCCLYEQECGGKKLFFKYKCPGNCICDYFTSLAQKSGKDSSYLPYEVSVADAETSFFGGVIAYVDSKSFSITGSAVNDAPKEDCGIINLKAKIGDNLKTKISLSNPYNNPADIDVYKYGESDVSGTLKLSLDKGKSAVLEYSINVKKIETLIINAYYKIKGSNKPFAKACFKIIISDGEGQNTAPPVNPGSSIPGIPEPTGKPDCQEKKPDGSNGETKELAFFDVLSNVKYLYDDSGYPKTVSAVLALEKNAFQDSIKVQKSSNELAKEILGMPKKVKTMILWGTGPDPGFFSIDREKHHPVILKEDFKKTFLESADKINLGANDKSILSSLLDKYLAPRYPAGSVITITTGPCNPTIETIINEGPIYRQEQGGIDRTLKEAKMRKLPTVTITNANEIQVFNKFFSYSLLIKDKLTGKTPLEKINENIGSYQSRLINGQLNLDFLK